MMETQELNKIFKRIEKDYLGNVVGVRDDELPSLFLVIGPSGSGKTTFAKQIAPLLSFVHIAPSLSFVHIAPSLSFVHIAFDDLRHYHPEYQKYLDEDPFSAVDKTNYDVNFWMQKLLSAAGLKRANVLLECTARGHNHTENVIRHFKDNAYQLFSCALCVPEEESALSIFERYISHDEKRFINLKEVANATGNFLDSLKYLKQESRTLVLVGRGGKEIKHGINEDIVKVAESICKQKVDNSQRWVNVSEQFNKLVAVQNPQSVELNTFFGEKLALCYNH